MGTGVRGLERLARENVDRRRAAPRRNSPGWRPHPAVVAAALAALVLATYWTVGRNAFLIYDDGEYVTGNPWVLAGLSWRGVAWAFGSFHSSNWHPLTWLSHMADVEVFGLDAGWHHRMSSLWHAATTVLLFAWLRDATGSTWRSALVAALFGVHPLHVESVAWVAERKDVLCAFFWMLALLAYTRWARGPRRGLPVTALAAFAAALLSKPMAVSLPAVLLLVDAWPLGRLGPGPDRRAAVGTLVREKLPFALLAAASCAVTLAAQGDAGAMRSLGAVPWPARLANAAVAAAGYLLKTAWPAGLSIFYPHPFASGGPSVLAVVASALFLLALSAGALALRRRAPALTVGWCWYLVTLLPVIGLVQVGSQGMADRYTYLPLVGVFVAVAFSLPAPEATRPALAAGAAWAAAVLALAVAARTQVAVWKDTFTVFQHAAAVTRGNWVAWKNLGVEHFRRGELPEALRAFEASVGAWPHDPAAWTNLAATRSALGDHLAAAEALRRTLALQPGDAEGWYLLGMEGHLAGRPEVAAEAVDRLRALRPEAARRLEAYLAGAAAR